MPRASSAVKGRVSGWQGLVARRSRAVSNYPERKDRDVPTESSSARQAGGSSGSASTPAKCAAGEVPTTSKARSEVRLFAARLEPGEVTLEVLVLPARTALPSLCFEVAQIDAADLAGGRLR